MILNIKNSSGVWVAVADYVAYQGLVWSRTDVEGSNAGTTISGITIRDRIASKATISVTCRPLTLEETSILLPLLDNEFVDVQYTDPYIGGSTSKRMYCNASTSTSTISKDGVDYWIGIAFTLTER